MDAKEISKHVKRVKVLETPTRKVLLWMGVGIVVSIVGFGYLGFRYFNYKASNKKSNAISRYYDANERKLERLQFMGVIPDKKNLLEFLGRNEEEKLE